MSASRPSEGWNSAERPELSPEHVALLSWWAEMIAGGQFPPPPGAAGPETRAARKQRALPRRATAIVLAAVLAVSVVTAAIVLGPKVLAQLNEDPVTPLSEVTLPAAFGGLALITDPQVGAAMRPLIGFGVRPSGVTTASAYGTDAAGDLSVAAMATTVGAPGDEASLIAAWSARSGSSVGEPAVGSGDSEGVTCVTAAAAPSVPAGAFCVWTSAGMRGQTYSVARSVEDAQSLTAQLRAATTLAGDAEPQSSA